MNLLSTIIFLPAATAMLALLLPRSNDRAVRYLTLAGMLASFVTTLLLIGRFLPDGGMQLVERATWVERFGIEYHLGVDGISLWLVVLTGLLGPIAVLASWNGISERVREFHVLLLLLQTGMFGVFLSLDLFLFYVFWEVTLIPMYFLIGVWGHERRLYAAYKFFVYTMAGSLLMLVAILSLVVEHQRQTGIYTFDLLRLYETRIPPAQEIWYFAAFALAFAIKVPMWPLHTWLPDAHVEAPTAGSVILAAVLLKMGCYGFLRFAIPLFPNGMQILMPLLMGLPVIGIIYGAMVAMVQPDLKKLVAYSSVSHLGFVMLGLFCFNTQGLQGSIYQMLNHGVSTGALFLMVGMLYERRHTRAIADFGGIAKSMPIFATLFIVVTLSSIGLPGSNGFVGEFLILLGTFKDYRLHAVLGATGVVLGAVYMLWAAQRVLFGKLDKDANRNLPDLSRRELAVLLPLVALIVIMGVWPRPFLDRMQGAVGDLIAHVEMRVEPERRAAAPAEARFVLPAAAPSGGGGAMIPLPTFTSEVWTLLGPLLVVFGTACLVLVLDLFAGQRRVPWNLISVGGLAIAAWMVLGRWGNPLPAAEGFLSGALRVDDLGVFLQIAILIAAALCLLPADAYLRWAGRGQEPEFHALALFSVVGMMLLVTSGELITLFLGLELLSFPTYVLCAFRRDDIHSNESALKYFVLGSFASSIFLYGVALCWGATGTTVLAAFGDASSTGLLHLGILFLLVGFLFKIGAAPFHMWVPDVYEGAPTPVTAFMATAVKVAAFGAFVRVLFGAMVSETMPLAPIFWWLACITMIVGNMSALTQDNIKRMLAFSSVAHAGYMLVGLTAVVVSGWDTGAAAVLFYLLAYVFMNVGAFTVVLLLSRRAEGDLNFDRDWSGAARRHPFLGAAMVVFMLGLGGIPPTAGFFGKYSLFKAAMDAGLTSLVIIAVLNSLVSVYYYLRVIVALYMRSERPSVPGVLESLGHERAHPLQGPGAMAAAEIEPPPPRFAARGAWTAKLVVAICLFATLWLGLGPALGGFPGVSQVIEWATSSAAALR